jgi:predicted enzyme related to lactoylglutathione lyase
MSNPVVKWQIVSRNPDQVAGFYSSVFGWQVDRANALGYRELRSGGPGGIDGGVWPRGDEGQDLLQLFIQVEDIDTTIQRAIDQGATVIVPKSTLPDGDQMAILADPTGMTFGLVRPPS